MTQPTTEGERIMSVSLRAFTVVGISARGANQRVDLDQIGKWPTDLIFQLKKERSRKNSPADVLLHRVDDVRRSFEVMNRKMAIATSIDYD